MSLGDFKEVLHNDYGQSFSVDKILFEDKTQHQHLVIFENKNFGRVMALDGIVQTTERDEFIYHEMLVHVPILSHGNVENVLIIGGGDGGTLREVLQHKNIRNVVMVEIDDTVVELSKKYLPKHSNGAFDSKRTNLIIADGIEFLKNTLSANKFNNMQFDVIIADTTDPVGPGQVLFTTEFYQLCVNRLTTNGIFVSQNGVPFFSLEEYTTSQTRLSEIFKNVKFYFAPVPTYVGGVMALGFATNSIENCKIISDISLLQKRFKQSKISTRYYNSDIHVGSYAVPEYLMQVVC